MSGRAALIVLALASLAAPLTMFSDGIAASWTFAFLVPAFPVALIALSVARGVERRPLGPTLLLLALLLEGCLAAMLLLSGDASGVWFGGLPLRLAILIYGLVLAPLLLVVVSYIVTFDRWGVREKDLERLRRLKRTVRGPTGGSR